jgi:hypothetical protein
MANSSKVYVAVDDSGGTIRDISNMVRRIRWPRSADMLESHGVGDTSKEFTAGLKDGDQVGLELIWDNTATIGFVAVFGSSSVGSTRSLHFAPNGNTSGQERLTNEAIIATIERGHGVGELVGATVTMQISGTVTEDTVP